jgi:hypothetical protein
MVQLPKYKQFMSEFVRQQMIVIGPDLAISTANRTTGLEVNNKGAALEIIGDPALVLKTMLGEFSKLSPHLTNYFIRSFFAKYPDIAEEFGDPLPKINFVCALIKLKA